jgi:hypothetical protein
MRIFLFLAGFVTMFGLTYDPVQATIPTTYTSDVQAQAEAKTFTGTILKSGESFVLSDSTTKSRYMLDDQNKASRFEGKHVKVTGTTDVASNLIHVETIQEVV